MSGDFQGKAAIVTGSTKGMGLAIAHRFNERGAKLRWAADLWQGERSAEDMVRIWGEAHPIGRVGQPQEIAELAAFLAGDSCTSKTGADLKVDGGVLANGILLPD